MSGRVEHIGDATLYLGDAADVVPGLSHIACVVTSPPYNTLGELQARAPTGMWAASDAGAGFVKNVADNGYDDDMDEDEYQKQQNLFFGQMADACCPDASLFYNHKIRWREKKCIHPVQWFKPVDWRLRQEIVWDRGGGMMFGSSTTPQAGKGGMTRRSAGTSQSA